ADADVHPAVAQREDPAVARQHVARPIPDVEVGLDPGLVVAGGGEVAANRHALRIGAVALGSECAPEPGVGTVGDHDIAGVDIGRGPAVALLESGQPGYEATV